ncbi:MAG: hypothetical protein AB7N91_12990 [Candidatus Tectimicrobiota bacterium]
MVTLLPDPDSPGSARTLPRSSAKLTPIDSVDHAIARVEGDGEILDLQACCHRALSKHQTIEDMGFLEEIRQGKTAQE